MTPTEQMIKALVIVGGFVVMILLASMIDWIRGKK